MNLPPSDERLVQARREFPQFYSLATEEEAALLDALVLAHFALQENMRIPRALLSPSLRADVEKMTNAVEQLFTSLREAVRLGSALAALGEDERRKIEVGLFAIEAPNDGR